VKYLSLALTALLFAVGCGGGSSSSSGGDISGINVHVTSPVGPGAVDSGLTLPITVSVTNDSSNAGVIWSVAAQHRGDPVGTLSDIKPDSVTYNPPAPDQVTATVQVTVTATSVTDPTRAAAIAVSVYPALAVTTHSSDLATAFLNTDYTCIQQPITTDGVIQIPCQINATGGLGPYTWSLASGALPDGTLLVPAVAKLPATSASSIVGKPGTVGPFPFTIKVADSLGGTSSLQMNVNVAPGQLKVVTPTVLSTTVGTPYTPIALQVSGGTPPYHWSLANGSGPLPPGMSLSPTGVIAGTPTSSSAFSFAVRVADSQNLVPAEAIFPAPALAGSAKIITLRNTLLDPTCVASGQPLQTGAPYAFVITGFDAQGPVAFSGSFNSDANGNLTGVEDIVRTSGAQIGLPLTAGSRIDFNTGAGRGCLTLNAASSSTQFRVAPTAITPGAFFSEGRIIEFDDIDGSGTRASGSFHIQDPSAFSAAALNESYLFRFAGWDASGGRFAMAGTAAANNGIFTSVSADVNDAGAASGQLSGGTGTIDAIDSNGRATASISIGTATYQLLCYVLDAQHLVFSSPAPASTGQPLVTGEAITGGLGPFSQASLRDSHIFRLGGHTPGSPDVGIGVLHFDGAGSVSGNFYKRSGGTSGVTALSGHYTVDPISGRLTFSGTGLPAVGYVIPGTTGITAYLLGTTASASSGAMEFQTNSYPPGYEFAPIVGGYGLGLDEMLDSQTTSVAGLGSDDFTGGTNPTSSFIDTSAPFAPGLIPVQNFTMFKYTFSPDGSGTYGGNTYMVTNGAKFFYIDLSPFNVHPAVVVGQLQSAPGIASFTPSCGPVGTTVVISGVNLIQTAKVAFDGVEATTFNVNTNTQVTATVPANATTGPITITTPIGSSTSGTSFTVQSSQCL
jgi:hypothetical protein